MLLCVNSSFPVSSVYPLPLFKIFVSHLTYNSLFSGLPWLPHFHSRWFPLGPVSILTTIFAHGCVITIGSFSLICYLYLNIYHFPKLDLWYSLSCNSSQNVLLTRPWFPISILRMLHFMSALYMHFLFKTSDTCLFHSILFNFLIAPLLCFFHFKLLIKKKQRHFLQIKYWKQWNNKTKYWSVLNTRS